MKRKVGGQPGQSVAQKERGRKAVDLKIAGATWAEVAKHTGYETEAGARLLVSRYFEYTAKTQFEEMQPIILERAELLWRKAWTRLNRLEKEHAAESDIDNAMKRCLDVLQQTARMAGLSNGITVDVNVRTTDDVRSLRDQFLELRGTPAVIDAEPDDDPDYDTDDS